LIRFFAFYKNPEGYQKPKLRYKNILNHDIYHIINSSFIWMFFFKNLLFKGGFIRNIIKVNGKNKWLGLELISFEIKKITIEVFKCRSKKNGSALIPIFKSIIFTAHY